ncbi:MAG: M20/M25/M40 family metallo-hydrolase, partial [bacterium]|nr:M20/M25/M40 family metallo-hydrolase [bacterium]
MAEKLSIRIYTPEELRMLAAEGRLKGRGIQNLVQLRPDQTIHDRPIQQAVFERSVQRLPGWSDPLPLFHTFLDLIQIHSPSGREGPVADYLSDQLWTLGFHDQDRDSYGNLLATKPATDPRAPNLLFTAHMDCVYPGNGASVKPVFTKSGEVRTDRQNSLGADDKAGIAAILSTLCYIKHAGLRHGEIRVVFTVQEELGYRGIKQVPANILNNIHLVLSMDPPVRVDRNETASLAVLHMPPAHPFVQLTRQAALNCGLNPVILFAEDGYVGGDTICLSPLGALVVDFCSCSRYPHTQHEHIRFPDLVNQTNWMIATTEQVLAFDPSNLELRALYGDEPIGALTGVRKQIPVTEDLLAEKRGLARALQYRFGPAQVPVLVQLSAITPRLCDPQLLKDLILAYERCLSQDQVPQVLRDITLALSHLSTNLADVRPLEFLIPVLHGVVERGGDEVARVNALNVLSELFQKERRVATKTRLLRTLILCLQSTSPGVIEAAQRFFRANLDHTIYALTVAFCNRNRAGWERTQNTTRIVNSRTRGREDAVRWTTIRQNILQILLEEDRILPEMLEWIFEYDGVATQQIAVGYIDPSHTTQVAERILHNLKSRQPGIQETAVHFVGTHRMVLAIKPLVDLLLNPHICRNRSLVEWSLDAIGQPALDEVVSRLGSDTDFAPFVRRMFNSHDRSTDADFAQLGHDLQDTYGPTFSLEDPSQLSMLGHYLGNPGLTSLEDLARWEKRRSIIFYAHTSKLYPNYKDLERLAELLEEADKHCRSHFAQMAAQVNIFEDPEFLTLIGQENARFLEHFVWVEKQVNRRVVLSRLREFMNGAQLDMADPQDVDLYYLYLLKQSPKMPDRTRYLKHIVEARRYLFPPVQSYCKAFTIVGDRIEEVGTVDRERVKALIADLPGRETREDRLRSLLYGKALAKKEKQRLINTLAEAYGIDVNPYNTLEDRAEALIEDIDFEFDAAYRTVPQIAFAHLMRVRMKHRADDLITPLADYALEYTLINHPEIQEVLDSGETDLLLDSLNDLFTDRVFEAERELSEDLFQDLQDKHVKALAQFYESQWKGILRNLKKYIPNDRTAEMVAATEQAMLEYDLSDEEAANQLDTNLNRLVQIIRPDDPDLLTFHDRHREYFKVYTAVLRTRNIRQLKRVYREVYLILQDELSFANREHKSDPSRSVPRLLTGDKEEDNRVERIAAAPGYLQYARKELGKLTKLMSDFILEKAFDQQTRTVQAEITKLRQIVIGTSQILCAPSKDVSIIYRSWPGNDCNTGDIKQIVCPDCSFYKIISDGAWKGYFTLVEVRRRNERAFLIDVLNFSGLKMANENFIKVLMHQVIQTAKAEGCRYVLTSLQDTHLSNRDYIRRAFRKVFPS